MRGVTNCPDAPALQRFLLGETTPAESADLESHIDRCDRCVASLQTLQIEDSLVHSLRAQRVVADADTNEAVLLLKESLKRLRPGTDANVCAEDQAIQTTAPSSRISSLSTGMPEACISALRQLLTPGPSPNELGQLGRYRIRELLGSGGMGLVFRAYDPQLEREVALKTLAPALALNPSAKQRFLREARTAGAIKHDHIVTIYEVGEDRNIVFLAMELLEGETLEQRLQREGHLNLPEMLRIARETAQGIAAAHEHGLIHRDIKPANIWLEGNRGSDNTTLDPFDANASVRPTPGGKVKILDFGLALPISDAAHLTQSGALVGTPAFMAPERLRDQAVDARADLFSLGCILYRMATGEQPFKGSHSISTLIAIVTTMPRPPQELNSELPPALCTLIGSLLAKNPCHRPPSAGAVVEAIHAIERDQSRPVGRSRKWLWAVAAMILGVLLGIGIGVWPMLWRDNSSQTNPELEDDGSARVVAGVGIGPKSVFSDRAHALKDVLDFRDLVGVTHDEFRVWHSSLAPDFRLALVSIRRGTGPTLFNAVAVREKTPQLVRILPDGVTSETHAPEWDKNTGDGFQALNICTFFRPDSNVAWTQTRLWVKDGEERPCWHGDLDFIKAKIEESKEDFRPIYLDCRPALQGPAFQAILGRNQGRKWEAIYSVNLEDLLRTVELYRLKGWRPDVVAPCWDDNRLQFMLVAVNNRDEIEWHFRMDMTLLQYRKESATQKLRGLFPLALASYGNDDEVRYVAMWIRGRVADPEPLPTSR